MSLDDVHRLAKGVGGTIREIGSLPDGSGFAMMSRPLHKDHWAIIDPDGCNVPPIPLRLGASGYIRIEITDGRIETFSRIEFAEIIRTAGRYAYRCTTMNGKEPDLDPDALLQNLIVGLLGYWTDTGLSKL